MNEKKSTGFAALILSVVVVFVAVFGVKLIGGTAAAEPPVNETPGVSGEQTPASKYGVGTYTASAAGYHGDVTVTITIGEGDVITDVVIEGPGETAQLGGKAIEKMQAAILAEQTVEVDGMASATFTSNAVLAAAAECMAQAAN